LRFSPNGKQPASGSFDTTIKIWDMINNKLNRTLDNKNIKTEIYQFIDCNAYINAMYSLCYIPNYDNELTKKIEQLNQ
jgi:WD40 repeat protein